MREGLRRDKLRRIYDRLARRYDVQHALMTVGADQRGRTTLVENTVKEGDAVLDCGAGTGTTGILAAKKVGADGKVVLLDYSEPMLERAREKVAQEKLQNRVMILIGDAMQLPFADESFDVVLSTYSLCPLYDPEKAALELYRVTKPGGKLAAAHSAEPHHPIMRRVARQLESLVWHFPWFSMGCRAIRVLPTLKQAGAGVVFTAYLGSPLWPFFLFIAVKPTL